MEIEKLIKHMRKEAQDYRSGRTLGRAFADAEDVLDEAATALEQLQAENDRLRRERNEAVECCSGYCTSCCFEHDCAKHDMNDAAPTRWYYGDCEDWEWQGVKEE